jgi:hypothetical protein
MTFAQFKVSNWRGALLTCAILVVSLRLFYVGERIAALTLLVAYPILVIVIRE